MRKLILFSVSWLFLFSANAQITDFNSGSSESFRGLSLLNDANVWISGTNGTYIFTENGGITWQIDSIAIAKGLDFRDVEVINDSTVYLLTAGSPALLLKTVNKGKDWNIVFEDGRKEAFMDGIDFWTDGRGIAYGDPIEGRFMCWVVDGDSAKQLINLPVALNGEAGFAASGTGIVTLNDSLIWIATGGGKFARVLFSSDNAKNWKAYNTPLNSGEGKGIFSMTFWNEKEGVIVGGSYVDSTNSFGNCAITKDGGVNWELISENQPGGYRSCVASNKDGSLLIAVGRTGIDVSKDKGKTWIFFSDQGYYSVIIDDKCAWFSGRNGKVGRANLIDF